MLQKSMLQHVDRITKFDEDSFAQLSKISKYFHDISNSLADFGNNKPSTSNFTEMDIFSTLNDAIMLQFRTMIKVQQYFYYSSKSILDTIDGSMDTLKKLKLKKMENYINEMNFAIEKLNDIDQVMERLERKQTSVLQKFGKMTNDIIAISNPVATKQFQAYFQKIVDIRKKLSTTKERIVKSAQESIDLFKNTVNSAGSLFTQRDDIMKALFSWYSFNFFDFGSKMNDFSNEIDKAADKIDFNTDFKSFANLKHLVRSDFIVDEFKPFDTSGPAFEGIEPIEIPKKEQLIPINIVKVIHDYQEEEENEISCKKGQYLLLMEDMDNDWVLCMNQIKIGFLPVNCIEKIGDKFGVIKSDIGMYVKGECVTIFSENNLCYNVVNLHGIEQIVDKEHVFIIHSKQRN